MGTTPIRYMWLGLAVAVAATLLVASPAVVRRQQIAHAEQIRARCVREFSAKRSWRAEITETETGLRRQRTVKSHQELLVRRPGEYRLTLRERDEKGREVVSTTIRAERRAYTRAHERRRRRRSCTSCEGCGHRSVSSSTTCSVRPSRPSPRPRHSRSWVAARATAVQRTSSSSVRGASSGSTRRPACPSRSRSSPRARRSQRGDRPASTTKRPRPTPSSTPASLGAAENTTVEDLGFRPVADRGSRCERDRLRSAATSRHPAGSRLTCRATSTRAFRTATHRRKAAFVSAFSNGPDGVIVTQVSRPGIGDSFVPAADETGTFERVDVGGTPAALFRDAGRSASGVRSPGRAGHHRGEPDGVRDEEACGVDSLAIEGTGAGDEGSEPRSSCGMPGGACRLAGVCQSAAYGTRARATGGPAPVPAPVGGRHRVRARRRRVRRPRRVAAGGRSKRRPQGRGGLLGGWKQPAGHGGAGHARHRAVGAAQTGAAGSPSSSRAPMASTLGACPRRCERGPALSHRVRRSGEPPDQGRASPGLRGRRPSRSQGTFSGEFDVDAAGECDRLHRKRTEPGQRDAANGD